MSANPKITDWSGRIVWVVGASSGIGRALAETLSARGARVIASARRSEPLLSLKPACARCRTLDVGRAADLQAATFFELDHQLDRLLAGACRNVFLVRSLAPLHAHCRRLWFLFRADVDMGDAARLHAHLARSVSVEDKTGAIRALNGIISVLEGLHARLEARS